MEQKFMCEVSVWLKGLNVPILYGSAQTYEKGSFFCVRNMETGIVDKWPVSDIFRVVESYAMTKSEGE